jgi:hypothetical protein
MNEKLPERGLERREIVVIALVIVVELMMAIEQNVRKESIEYLYL